MSGKAKAVKCPAGLPPHHARAEKERDFPLAKVVLPKPN